MTAYLRSSLAVLVTALLTHCSSITPVPTVSFTDHQHAMLFDDLEYEVNTTGEKIIVPAGFVTDYASIPLSVRQYFEVGGQAYQYPAIVHDWLYWSQTTTREEADRIFDEAMKDSGVGSVKRSTIWAAVRAGGDSAWESNRKEREQGLPKIIPEPYRSPKVWPKNVSWPSYRQQLYAKGVRAE